MYIYIGDSVLHIASCPMALDCFIMAIYILQILVAVVLTGFSVEAGGSGFSIREATVHDMQMAFKQNRLSSRQLVELYIREIQRLNPVLRGVIEVNPDALYLADLADQERKAKPPGSLPGLHGIPILVKDNTASKDKLNTTAGSYALLGSVVPRDAGVVKRLRKAGAIVLGKASLSEWSYFRSNSAPSGWSGRGGQGVNPYVKSADPCGSSSGSAISVAANMAAVTLGTETAGSILCPSSANSVVGIKPTVGLTSRSGVVPISHRQDTVGPICRTVSDAAHVLDSIVGFDPYDAAATGKASKYIPQGGYVQFLKTDGLRGKRLGIANVPGFGFYNLSDLSEPFQRHFRTLRRRGAVLVEVEVANFDVIASYIRNQDSLLTAEFKLDINSYLKQLLTSPVRSLADLIAFNKKHSALEKIDEYGQDLFLDAEKTNGIGKFEQELLLNLTKASKIGFERLMRKYRLDALVSPESDIAGILAVGQYPGIVVPAGYEKDGKPFGMCFSGLKGWEPKLIEIAYSFEQASKIRKPPSV